MDDLVDKLTLGLYMRTTDLEVCKENHYVHNLMLQNDSDDEDLDDEEKEKRDKINTF